MTNQEIEAWALRVVSNVGEKRPIEDSRIEIKSEWPDAVKTARQLAGHLNAARRADILWLIGVDEKHGLVGASQKELATWFAQLQTQFEGMKPSMVDLNIPFPEHGKDIVALLFKSDRAPYLTRVPGSDRLEVPWREGTSTRSAQRDEILSLAVEHGKDPEVEIHHIELAGDFEQGATSWNLLVTFYLIPVDDRRIVIPCHRCSVNIRFASWGNLELRGGRFGEFNTDSIVISDTEAIVRGPGMLELQVTGKATTNHMPGDPEVNPEITLGLVKPHFPITFTGAATFMGCGIGRPGRSVWEFRKK